MIRTLILWGVIPEGSGGWKGDGVRGAAETLVSTEKKRGSLDKRDNCTLTHSRSLNTNSLWNSSSSGFLPGAVLSGAKQNGKRKKVGSNAQ